MPLHRRTLALLLLTWLLLSMPAAAVASPPTSDRPDRDRSALPFRSGAVETRDRHERYIVHLEGAPAAFFAPRHEVEAADVADAPDANEAADAAIGIDLARPTLEAQRPPGPEPAMRSGATDADFEPRLAALRSTQDRWLLRAEAALGRRIQPRFRYLRAFNGLSLDLAPGEAERLRGLEGQRALERERWLSLQTDLSPTDTGADRVWRDPAGVGGGPDEGFRGEGLLIGFLDGGIDPEHPAFAAEQESGYRHRNPFGSGTFLGHCDPGSESHDESLACNDKLVGMWSWPESGDDPRDDNGHGTHVAAIAAGNPIPDVQAEVASGAFLASVSGIAPRANVIAYDVCAGGCPSSVILAAIEQAVEDGVDLLNFSISLPRESPWAFSVSRAFLGAEAAGILVVKSGGNGGPATGSADPSAPWILSVGAASHGRSLGASLVELSGGADAAPDPIEGMASGLGFGPGPIVRAEGLRHRDGGTDDGRCAADFESESLKQRIVVCDRSDESEAAERQAEAVLAAGAAALILADARDGMQPPAGLPAALPTLHLGHAAAQALHAWLAGGSGHSGRLEAARGFRDPARVGRLWPESGRGPAVVRECCRREGLALDERAMNWLAPGLVAPGVAVLSARAGAGGQARYLSRDGTSMAAPHATGAAALLRERWPQASPSELRSMLMLHGADGASDGRGQGLGALDAGAGRLEVWDALRSGLALGASPERMALADPALGGEPASINQAALVEQACVDRCAWRREIRSLNAERGPIAYRLRLESDDPDLGLEVAPEVLEIGASAEGFELEADVSRLAIGETVTGRLVFEALDAALPAARIPIVLRRSAGRLPDTWVIRTDQPQGAERLGPLVAPAFETLGARVRGLTRADAHEAELPADPSRGDPFDALTGTLLIALDVAPPPSPAADRLVVEVVDAEAPDVDLYLGRDEDGDGMADREELRCASARAGWVELCEQDAPAAGRWWALAQVWAGSGTDLDRVELRSAVVVAADAGNFQVRGPEGWPARQPFEIEGRWRLPELLAGDRWYGSAELDLDGSAGGSIGRLRIDLLGAPEGPHLPTATAAATSTPSASPPSTTAAPSTTASATATASPSASATTTASPSATATATASPSASATMTASPAATPAVDCVCAVARRRVPAVELDEAIHNPERFGGWDQPVNANKPPGLFNPRKRCLSIRNASAAYHPLFNGMVFKSGCP